jgi:glycosyltransferase involved in cell wall biosynthesis
MLEFDEGMENEGLLSVCVIVKDGDDTLKACLESVKPLNPEIIVVDTGSTDLTVDIAREYTDKVYEEEFETIEIDGYEWLADFSAARNSSIEKATGEFILIWDADNILDHTGLQAIHGFLQNGQYDVGNMQIIHRMDAGDSLQWQHRIFRRGVVHYEGIKHNRPIFDAECRQAQIQCRILHSGFNLSPEQQDRKTRRDEVLLLKQIEMEPDRIFHYANLVRNYRSTGQWQKVIDAGIEGYAHWENVESDLMPGRQEWTHSDQMISADMIYAYSELGNLAEGLKLAESVLEKYPDNVDVKFYAAYLYSESGKYEKAIELLSRYLLELDQYIHNWRSTTLTLDTIDQAHQAWHNLGVSYFKIGRSDRSVSAFKKASQLRPDNVEYIRNYAGVLERENRRTRRKAGKLKVLFLQRAACIRNAKMAMALTAKGHDVGLAFQSESLDRYGLSDSFYCDIMQLPHTPEIPTLAAALREIGDPYDIIHVHNEPDMLTAVTMGVYGGKKPIVHDVHDLISLRGEKGNSEQVRYLEHLAIQYADALIFVSEVQAQQAHTLHGIKNGKAHVIHNYALASHLPEKRLPKLRLDGGGYNIVYEGGLRIGGYRDYREIFTELAGKEVISWIGEDSQGNTEHEHCAIHIHIYPAFDIPEYEKLAEDNEYLHYYQPVPPDKLLTELSRYDAGIIPLQIDDSTREMKNASMPNKLFEYFYRGKRLRDIIQYT